jgi:FAD dependent oxidoreductase TIGR03364
VTQAAPRERFDLAVVGAGILGLAMALAGARRGLKIVVIDRDAEARGASIRNFGFVTLSGQASGAMWARARRSLEVWREVAASAAIPLVQNGAWFIVRRPESARLLEAFLATEMGAGCHLLSPVEARRRCPQLVAPQVQAVLESSAELRVESREAIPRLAAWLAAAHCVEFRRGTVVTAVEAPLLRTSRGNLVADRIVVCPGDDFNSLYAERLAGLPLSRCALQMLRLASPGFTLPAVLLSDLSLARYAGFAELPAAAPLKARLAAEQPEQLKHGVHLIVAQSADGTLVVGDSHNYGLAPEPFSHESIDALILEEFRAATGLTPPATLARWSGTYAVAADRPVLIDAPEPAVRLAIVTSGAGASTGFAIAEEVIGSLDGAARPG